MSRPIFIAKCKNPSVTFIDEWLSVFDDDGEVRFFKIFLTKSG